MCYRYSVPGPDLLVKRFSAVFLEEVPFKRQYHASSFDLPKLPVITNEQPQQIQLFTWGLIPFWVKDTKTAEEVRLKTMNARAESIFEKPSFRSCCRAEDIVSSWLMVFSNGRNTRGKTTRITSD